MLPASYQRGYSESSRELILGLLASARSIDGVPRSLRQMGVSVPETDLQRVVDTLVEQLDLLNTRPPDPDCLAVFMDARHIEVRSGKHLVQAAVHTVVGIDMQGRKRIHGCQVREGAESLERWKEVERFEARYATWIGYLRRNCRRLLAFLGYPSRVRASWATTNTAEAVN
ncbi:MAG: transposase, partial [Bryobacterales bacterium]|nr:transposase [Bryobacterales bacterium]